MKKFSKVLSAILSLCIIMSVCSVGLVFASGEKVLMSWDGESTINLSSDIAEVKEFQGENVINLRTKTAGRNTANCWALTDNRNLNKHLSFQIYVPSEDYYFIDLRLAATYRNYQDIRNSGDISYISQFTFVTDSANGRSIIGVRDGAGGSYVTKGIYGLDKWHTVDIYVNDKTVSYYVDYEHVTDTNIIAGATYNEGFDHAFKGFHMCIGENNRTTGTEEGMYLRKVKLTSEAPYLGANILNDNFEGYTVDTEITDGTNVTGVTSGINAISNQNFASAVVDWVKDGRLGFKKLANGNTVFVARNTSTNNRVGTGRDTRFGFFRGRGAVGLNRGPITIEMDINIPDKSKLAGIIIQPFSDNSAGKFDVNSGGIVASANTDEPNVWNNTSTVNARTAYASLLVPCSTNTLFNLKKDGQIYFAGDVDANGNFYHSKAYNQGEWANLKLIVSKEGDASYKTKVYLNDEYFGEQSTAKTAANALQTAATDNFRGVRFMSAVNATSTYVEDLYYIDNVKMYLNEGATTIYDIREFKLVDNNGDIIDGEIPAGTESIEAGIFIDKNKSMAYNAQLILAQYDKDGNMIMCGVKELPFKTASAGSILGAGIKQNLAEGAKTVKAFLWTDTIQPMNIKLYEVK